MLNDISYRYNKNCNGNAVSHQKHNLLHHMTNGAEKEVSVKTSNKFHDGTFDAPESITVIGGKTGTTSAAGSCLSLVTRDSKGNPYIAVILHASERSVLYEEMIKLLEEINSR